MWSTSPDLFSNLFNPDTFVVNSFNSRLFQNKIGSHRSKLITNMSCRRSSARYQQQFQESDIFLNRNIVESTNIITKPYLLSSGVFPPLDEYAGPYDFAVLLGQMSSSKNKWTYSERLNKLYIVWHQIIPIEFRWLRGEPNLVVRALPVYVEPQHFREPVLRCLIHSDPMDPINQAWLKTEDASYSLGLEELKHVIRSENPGAVYEINAESGRASVVVPLGEPQPGTGTVTVTYKFMCKTSCVTGMMRRQVSVIFTLERLSGEVLGRQMMGIKVCSCPKRDMDKEEDALYKQCKEDSSLSSRDSSSKPYKFEVSLPDPNMFRKVLEFQHGAITSLMRTIPPNDQRYSELNDCLQVLEEKLACLSSWE